MNFNELRNNLSQERKQRKAIDRQLQNAREQLRTLQLNKARLARAGRQQSSEYLQLLNAEAQLQGQIPDLIGSLKSLTANNIDLLAGFAEAFSQKVAIRNLNDRIPILLFPVRIETRFMPVEVVGAAAITELWIRIYPDNVQVETHEEQLTADELLAAQDYWQENWKAGGNKERELAAWRVIASGYGSNRAAWIICEAAGYHPTNPGDKPVAPVPEGEALAILPQFPEYEGKLESWSRAPRTETLPDRFVVMGFEGGEVVIEAQGAAIPDPLIVGPNPAHLEEGEGFKEDAEELEVDAEMKWMVDFEEAVKVGMGIRIPLTGEKAKYARLGFDRLMVVGLRLSSDEVEGKELLEGLIDSHHYSEEGFSLVPQGTNTNNTQEGGGAGYSSFELGEEGSFDVELGDVQFTPNPDWKAARDGQYLAQALGIDFDPLQHIQHADGLDQRDARAMNTALWHSTLGYFMEEMMRPVFSSSDIRSTRDFFIRYVSGRGPIPAFRVGNQPYGVLATTAFSKWQVPGRLDPTTGQNTGGNAYEPKLYQVLERLDQDWNAYAKEVSFAGKPGDSAQNLLDMMGLHASSAEYHQRFAIGIEQLSNLLKIQNFDVFSTEIVQYLVNKGREILVDLGYDQLADSPEILAKLFFTSQTLLDGPLIDVDPASENASVKPITVQAAPEDPDAENYIEWLASRTLDEIRREDFGEDLEGEKIAAPTALMYLMLRQSLMLAYFDTAYNFHVSRKQVSDPVRNKREPELMYVAQENPGRSKLSYLYTRNEAITGTDQLTVAEYVSNADVLLNPQFQFETQALRDVKEAMDLLGDASTARLERAFSEHIDLCSYRLDAWKTGLVRHRLEQLRGPADDRQTGVYLGAFAWLEDLRPRARLQDFAGEIPEELLGENQAPIKQDPENAGFIHGPSLNHAVTAAVLRNAYLSHAEEGNDSVMSVNLSSERVRMAMSLIEGIRNGQGLSELLGYRFERGLHERYGPVELDRFILPLREKFPLRANRLNKAPAGTSIEEVEARNVIDGLRLLEHIRESGNATYPFGLTGLPAANGEERDGISAEADRMANLLDAVSDLSMAEGVFQVAQGNYERAGAMMKAVTEGNNPPDPEIAQTPRSGHALTQRVAIQFETNIPAAQLNPYPAIPLTPRAKAEPGLNKWIASLLGNATEVVVRIIRVSGGVETPSEVSLEDLAIQPIDLLYLTPTNLKEELAELDERIAMAVKPGLNPDDTFRIAYTAPVPGKKTLFELMPLLRSIRSMVGDARPLTAEDMHMPTDSTEDPEFPQKDNPHGYDVNELAVRVATTYFDLTTIKNQLTEIITVGGPLDAARYSLTRNILLATSYFGVPQSIPKSLSGESPELEAELLEQAAAVLELVKARTDAYELIDPGNVPVSEGVFTQVQAFVDAGKAVLGGEFKWMPTFTHTYPGELQLAIAASEQMVDNTGLTLPVDDWLHGVARVREKINTLEQCMLMAENFGSTDLDLTPIQLPYQENDHWVAVEYPESYEFEGDKLLVNTHYTQPFDATKLQAGLMLDEWVEVVPTKEETSGIAFHFDRPNSEPAQTLILAVSPNLNGSWQWEDLIDTLTETLDMAKKRAVEPQHLDNNSYAQLLPAVMVPVTKYLYSLTTNLAANVGMVNAISNIELANTDNNG